MCGVRFDILSESPDDIHDDISPHETCCVYLSKAVTPGREGGGGALPIVKYRVYTCGGALPIVKYI